MLDNEVLEHHVHSMALLLGNEVLKHHAHSMALLPHNCHIFGPFTSDDNMQGAVVQWFRQQHKVIFADWIC
jgi:hypothetical protein